ELAEQAALAGEPRDSTAPASSQEPDAPKHKIGDLELSEEDVRDLLQRHALEQSRKATLPASPADYRLELPADFQVPQGIEFRFDENHPINGPILADARAFAHAQGFSQEQFSRLLGFHAAAKVAEMTKVAELHAAELGKLGANAQTRVDAVTTWLRSQV